MHVCLPYPTHLCNQYMSLLYRSTQGKLENGWRFLTSQKLDFSKEFQDGVGGSGAPPGNFLFLDWEIIMVLPNIIPSAIVQVNNTLESDSEKLISMQVIENSGNCIAFL